MQQIPTDRLSARLHALLWLIGLVAGAPLAGQAPELSETVPLNADRLMVDLWDADLDILVRSDTKPILRTEAAAQGYSVDVELRSAEADTSGLTTMHFRRATGTDRDGERLRVEMVVHPAQELRIAGRGLDILFESGRDAPARVELVAEDSAATFSGLRDLHAEVTDTVLRLAETGGGLDLTLTSGTLEILGHQGSLALASTETDVELTDVAGNIEANLEGGSLRMDRGTGAWTGQARDALLVLDGWQGELGLTAWNSTFEARGAPEPAFLWKLSGADLTTVILEETEGPLEIDLVGGRLQAQGLRGDGQTTLKLSEGAEARLVEVDGALEVTVEDGELEVDGAAVLGLGASRSTVTLGNVRDLRRLDAIDATLTVDLTATATAPRLLLAGQSDADVSLTTPCAVQISAASTAPESQVEVTGCDLRLPTQKPFKPLDPGLQFVLMVTLKGESVLRVED